MFLWNLRRYFIMSSNLSRGRTPSAFLSRPRAKPLCPPSESPGRLKCRDSTIFRHHGPSFLLGLFRQKCGGQGQSRNNVGRLLRGNDRVHVHRTRVVRRFRQRAETPTGAGP